MIRIGSFKLEWPRRLPGFGRVGDAFRSRRFWRLMMWTGVVLGTLFAVATVGTVSAIGWLATHHTKDNPMNITRYVPYAARLWTGYGLAVDVNRAEIWFDNGVVLRVNGLEVFGTDGEMAIAVDQMALKLAYRRLLALIPAPKELEAEGVTLRLVRGQGAVAIAGLDLKGEGGIGAVEWLNGLNLNAMWGRLREIKIANLNLLLRDDVQNAEWVLEDGALRFDRHRDTGERASIVAQLRRLYGSKEVPTMPILVTLDHPRGDDKLTIEGRFERADMALVADYLPPQLREFLRGEGQLAIGTTLMEGNVISQPWITVRLANVSVMPPAGYAKPMVFADVLLSAAYAPTPTDVMFVRQAVAKTEGGLVVEASGTVAGMGADHPVVDLSFSSSKGEVQQVVDLLPDVKLAKPVKWLTENLDGARFANLRGRWAHDVTTMVNCDKECGLDIYADLVAGKVRYVKEFPWATMVGQGTFYLGNGGIEIKADAGKSGTFSGEDITVRIEKMFLKGIPADVVVIVEELRGKGEEVIEGLAKVVKKPAPVALKGDVAGRLDMRVALIKGRPVIVEDITPNITADLSAASLANVPGLKGVTVEELEGTVNVTRDKVTFAGAGLVDGDTVDLTMQDSFLKFGDGVKVGVKGRLPMAQVQTAVADEKVLAGSGVVAVDATVQRTGKDAWQFAGLADLSRAAVQIPMLNWQKGLGQAVNARVEGKVGLDTVSDTVKSVQLTKLSVQGSGVNVQGSVDAGAEGIRSVNLKPFILGDNNASVVWKDGLISVAGTSLDLRGVDLMGKSDKSNFENGSVQVDLARLLVKEGTFSDVNGRLTATDGRWQINRFIGRLGTDGLVRVVLEPLEGQAGREVLKLDVQRVGDVLRALGLYGTLGGGHLTGEITYDAPGIGGGVLTIRDFEMRKPPVMMQILSLLSLTQLVEGTDAVRFSRADIPLRLDGPWVYLDRAKFEGASMSLRLDGNYNRDEKQLNIDGSLVPALPFNRLVTKIPLVGTLLSGSQDGVVVADFKLKGPTDNPQVSVKPLSVLTPGLLKDFWRGLTGGGSANPPPSVQDGRSR